MKTPVRGTMGTGRLRTALTLAVGLALTCAAARSQEDIHAAYLTDADLAAVERLIAAGADVNSTHIAGGTALHHLVTTSAQMGLDGLMIRDKKIVRPGEWQATGHEQIAALLVANGADVNARDAAGKTPLHVAALTGHAAAAEFLLQHGAEAGARDAEGRTPLDWAHWSASDEAIAELAAATGARVNARGVKRRAQRVIEILESASTR